MITRREVVAGSIAGSIAGAFGAGAFGLADSAAPLGSRVFDWDAIPARQTETGSVRSICKEPTATLDELEIHVTTLDAGKAPHPPHRHPNEELVILRQGALEALENGQWTRVGPGSVIFSASNQLHGLRNPGTEPAVYHVINWKSSRTPQAAANQS